MAANRIVVALSMLLVLLASSCVVAERTTIDRNGPPAEASAPAPTRAPAPAASAPLVRGDAPEFVGTAVMTDNSFAPLALASLRDRYVVLFFYPMDFTFVCPTEIIAFDEKLGEFEKRNCAVVGVSVDSQFTHLAWKNTPRDKGGIGSIHFPLIADVNKRISRAYGVLWNDEVALRGLFIIDPKGKVRHALINDLPVGRSVAEALRTLDAVLFVDTHGDEVCPANWHPGQEAVKKSADGLREYFSKQGAKE